MDNYAEILILDFETLSSKSTAMQNNILPISFGAVVTNFADIKDISLDNLPKLIEELRAKSYFTLFDPKVMLSKGFKTDPNTLKWWSEQTPEARYWITASECNVQQLSIEAFCEEFRSFCVNNRVTADTLIVVRSPQFDMPILENLFKVADRPLPFCDWNVVDIRSLMRYYNMLTDENAITKYKVKPGYDKNLLDVLTPLLEKHYPVDDCIIDLVHLSMLYNI